MKRELEQLETLLRKQIESHQKLVQLLHEKLAALRKADRTRVTHLCQRENEQVQQIGELEKQRLVLIAELTRHVTPQAPAPLSLVQLCEHLQEPDRGRLLVLRSQLRQLIEQAQQQSSLARRAAEMLLRHMQGLVQSIGAVVTVVGTYTRQGAMPRQATAMSTFVATA